MLIRDTLGAVTQKRWYLLSTHGLVLTALVRYSGPTVQELAQKLGLSRITVIRVLKDLREAGMLDVERRGRRNVYRVRDEVSFRHPVMSDSHISVLVDAFRPKRK